MAGDGAPGSSSILRLTRAVYLSATAEERENCRSLPSELRRTCHVSPRAVR